MKDIKTKNSEALLKMDIWKLKEEIKKEEKKLFSLRMKLSLWELKQTHTVKLLRRYIAKLNTLMTAKLNNN
jgi:ribosomal protein L29